MTMNLFLIILSKFNGIKFFKSFNLNIYNFFFTKIIIYIIFWENDIYNKSTINASTKTFSNSIHPIFSFPILFKSF